MARLATLLLVLALAGAGWMGFRLIEARLAADIYRDRLQELVASYDALRDVYNEAVLRSAVTELIVGDGTVQVSIRTADGVLDTIPTPYDPERELYVDYVVIDDRLWIRRVFDEDTPPGEGVVIDPSLVKVDWDEEGARFGKATYRKLDPGRWVVTVTGDGSLGLGRRRNGDAVALSAPPPVRDYPQIETSVRDALSALGPREVIEKIIW